MESLDLDMNDIFDRDGEDAENDGEDYGLHAGLPDLDIDEDVMRPLEDPFGEQNEDDEVLANLKNLSKGAAKKKVQRPQPKLDPERLKNDRGLPALTKLFKDTQFKGKGYEVDDLKLLMGKLEHWAHRLYPKMPFDDFIERLEKLGGKKEIQTCVKRIRLDMPILDEDFVSRQDEETKGSDNENASPNMSDAEDPMDAELAYDEMIQRERNAQDVNSGSRDNSPNSRTQLNIEPTTPIQPSLLSANSPPSVASSLPSSSQKISDQVTTEQQQRMERNRLLALQKRAERLGLPIPTSPSQASASDMPLSSQPSDNKSVGLSGNKDCLNAGNCWANNLKTEDSVNRIQEPSQEDLLSVETAVLRNIGQSCAANNIDQNLGKKLPNPADESNLESVTSDELGQETMQTEEEILESLTSS